MAVNDTGHYPQQAAITAYGNGGFRFANMSHRGSLLCLPSGMHAWAVMTADEISLETLAPVLEQADDIDVLLIGMGNEIGFISPAVRDAFRAKSVIVEGIGTGSAIRTYNVLLAEERAVAAALIAVDRVR